MAWYRCVGGAGGSLKLRTASGAIATFNTNIVDAFKSLKSDINPLQDLHGYSKPWSGGGGKNKLNYDAWKTLTSVARGTAVFENNGVKITATGNDAYTDFSNTGFPVNARVPVTEGETITLSWQETTNARGTVMIFPNGQPSGYVSIDNAAAKKLSYTVPSGVTYISFRFGVLNSGDTIAYKNIQIEKGSQATAYEPYSNICPISGFSALNVTRTGKNLLNNSDITTTQAAYVINNVNVSLIAGYYMLSFDFSGTSSSSSLRIDDENGTAIFTTSKTIISGHNEFLINLPSKASFVKLFSNAVGTYSKFQIEQSNQATAYEPYNGQTATVNFGQTVYGGVCDVTNGKVTLTHGYYQITGTENWAWGKSSTYSGGFYTPVTSVGAKVRTPFICTHAKTASTISEYEFGTCYCDQSLNFRIMQASDTVQDWKNYLASQYFNGTPVSICYELATPIEITTTPENLTAIVGQNNVYADTNGDMEVKYLYRE